MRRAVPPMVVFMAVWLASQHTAGAEPRVRLLARTACPSGDQLRTALAAEHLSVGERTDAGWHLRITSHPRGARLVMVRADGAAHHERTIDSGDCAAMADAFALIVSAHIRRHPAAPPTPSRAAVTDSPAVPTLRPRPPGAVRAAPPRRANPRLRWAVGVETGVEGTASPSSSGGYKGLIVATTRHDGWGLQRALRLTDSREVGDWVWRAENNAMVQVTRRVSYRGLWAAAGAGGGMSMSSLAFGDGGRTTRLHPTVNGSITGGIGAGRYLSVRGSLGVQVFPIADDYTLPMEGVVGQSPRAAMHVGIGVQVAPGGW